MSSTKPIEDNDNAKEFWENLADATDLETATKTTLRAKIGAASAETADQAHRLAVWTNDWLDGSYEPYATVTAGAISNGDLAVTVTLDSDSLFCPLVVPNAVQKLTINGVSGAVVKFPQFTAETAIDTIAINGDADVGVEAYRGELLNFLENVVEVTPDDFSTGTLTVQGTTDPEWDTEELTDLRAAIADLDALGWDVSLPNFITGTAYPGETLFADFIGQWTVDGDPVGSPSLTYVVSINDIGKDIAVTGSQAVTAWHPNEISAVQEFYWARANVFNSISPNVAATNGQTVRRWGSVVGSATADQATSTFQPIYRSTGQSGGPSLEFDAVNDSLNLLNSRLANVAQAYLIVGCRDTNPTGAMPSHFPVRYSVNGATTSRLSVGTRIGSANTNMAAARRFDAGTTAFVTGGSASTNYRVYRAHGDYSNGFVRGAINGTSTSSTALASGSGNTSNTNSLVANIGGFDGSGDGSFPGHITCVFVCVGAMTATEISQLERFAGLHGGLNIPLV